MNNEQNNETAQTPSCFIHSVVDSACCPNCGSINYQEYEELMYENGSDDPQYGGKLKLIKFGNCNDCG